MFAVRTVGNVLLAAKSGSTASYVEAYIVPGWVGWLAVIGVLAILIGLLMTLRMQRRRRECG